MTKSYLSIEENIETLKRSRLPTIVTEGRDDYRFYRRIEETLQGHGVSLFPVGGRGMVFDIFHRRKELGRNNVMFIADLDMFVYTDVPSRLRHRKIVFTNGYSIENDLYRDGELEMLLYASEREVYERELDELIGWFSFCVHRLLNDQDACISEHPSKVLRDGRVCPMFASAIGYAGRIEPFYGAIRSRYERLLRGKTLIQFLLRHLCVEGRATKYSRMQLMEFACSRNGSHYSRILTEARQFFIALDKPVSD